MLNTLTKTLGSRISLLVASLLLLGAFGGIFYADTELKKTAQQLHKLSVNSGEILNADTASTTAVRLAAALKSDRYVHNYQDFQDTKYTLLNEILEFPKNAQIAQAFERMAEVQDEIEKTETDAIGHIDEEEWDKALVLVTSPAFRRIKNIYKVNLSSALRSMILESQRQEKMAEKLAQNLKYAVLGVFILLALIGLLYSRKMHLSLRRQSELAANLEDTNENLEQRVQDRTRELNESQAVFRTVLDTMPAVVFLKDLEGRFRLINTQYEEVYGITFDAVEGKNLHDVYPKELADHLTAIDRQVIDAGGNLESENSKTVNGAEMILSSVLFPIFDENGTMNGLGGIEIDITDRKQAEDAMREIQEGLSAVLEASPVGVSIFDADDKRIYVNARVAEMFGHSKEDLIGAGSEMSFADLATRNDLRARYAAEGRVDDFEAEFVHADGGSFWVLLTMMPVSYGGQQGRLVWIYDITERRLAELEIARQKTLLEATMENMDQAIGMWDADNNLVAYNGKLKQMQNLPEALFELGTPIEDWYRYIGERGEYNPDTVFDFDSVEEAVALRMASVRRGEPIQYERELPNGHTIEIRRNPIDAGGFVSTLSDITLRKRAEAELRIGEERLQLALKGGDLGYFDVNFDTAETAVNEHWAEMLGYTHDEIDDFEAIALKTFHPEDKDRVDEYNRRNAAGEIADYEIEYRVITKQGETRWQLSKCGAVRRDDQGRPRRIVGTVQDITERKQTEIKIKESEERFRATFEQAAVGFAIVHLEGRWLRVNDRLCEITGYDRDILITKTFQEITHPDDLDTDLEHVANLVAGKVDTYSMEKRYFHDDGHVVWVNLTVALEREPDGTPRNFISVIEDISARKKAEQEIREQHESMALLNRVAVAVNEAVSADEAIGDCLREICVSLNWPVAHAYLHRDGGDPPLQPTTVWHVDAAVDIAAFRKMTEATGFNLGQGLPGRVLEANAPAWIVDVTKDANFPRATAAEAIGVKAGMAFPVSIGEDVIAVMEFFSYESAEPDQRVLDTLGNIGRQLGSAIRRKIAEQDLQQAYSVISESVEYASNIQRAALPASELLELAMSDHFVIWEPRDVVGGDIYWCLPLEDGFVLAVADCTGHGVPGAFVALVASGALRYALSRHPEAEPATLIADMNRFIKEVLAQYTDDSPSDDGLELGVCRISSNGGGIDFAGARFSLWQVVNSEIREIKGDKTGIGYCNVALDLKLNSHHVDANTDSRFYMISDGFNDQVGGEKRLSLGKKKLLKLLQDNVNEPMEYQRTAVMDMFTAYQGDESRRDDITMVGFKL